MTSTLGNLIDELAQHGDRTLVQAWAAQGPQEWSYRYIGDAVQARAGAVRT